MPIVGKWFNEYSQNGSNYFDTYGFKNLYLHYPILEDQTHSDYDIQYGYTELTFEQFKEQILKEPNETKFSRKDIIEFSWWLTNNLGQYSDDYNAHLKGEYLKQWQHLNK